VERGQMDKETEALVAELFANLGNALIWADMFKQRPQFRKIENVLIQLHYAVFTAERLRARGAW